MFILTGLTIVASSGNLLILRFVETNTKRCQHERYEMEERRRQKVRVVGDVISSNGRLLTVDDDEILPTLLHPPMASQHLTIGRSSSDLSLCSCRGHHTSCIPMSCKKRFKHRQPIIANDSPRQSIQVNIPRTLREEVLDALERRNEIDENIALDRSYLQLDQILKRTSI
jgi:ribosome-associated protein YbcJ (S4-like RNA binding protein)